MPADLDLRGRRVAVVWQGEFGGAEIRTSLIGGPPQLISTIPGSGAAAFDYRTFGISIVGGTVYWMVAQAGDTPYLAEVRRHAIASGVDERAFTQLDESSDAFAQDGDIAYYARPASGEACSQFPCLVPHELHRLDRLTFGRAPRLRLR